MVRVMDLLAIFAKNSAIIAGTFIIFAIIGFVVSWMTEIKVAFFLMLMIPLSVIAFDYWMSEKKERTHSDTSAK
jgi:uncharacterized membrane protein